MYPVLLLSQRHCYSFFEKKNTQKIIQTRLQGTKSAVKRVAWQCGETWRQPSHPSPVPINTRCCQVAYKHMSGSFVLSLASRKAYTTRIKQAKMNQTLHTLGFKVPRRPLNRHALRPFKHFFNASSLFIFFLRYL